MLDRFLSTLVALVLAFLIWLYARSRDQEMLDHVPIPVHLTLAAGQAEQYVLEVNGPSQVPVSFTGPPARIRELRRQLQRGELSVVVTLAVPEDRQTESRYLDTVVIEASEVHAPPGVTPIVSEGRNRILVTFHRLVERRLPVRFEHAPEDRIGQAVLEPATVVVRGPAEVLDRLRTVPTQPYVLPRVPEGAGAPQTLTVGPIPLPQELEGHPIRVTPSTVTARLTVQPRQKTYELEVPVRFLCPPNFALRPQFKGRNGTLSLRVLGPAQEEPPVVVAYVDLTRGEFKPGLYDEAVQLQLPKDFQPAQKPPRSVQFELVPPDLTGRGLVITPGP
jgi:hypothetical protein